ncbi:MAG TPA: hypothetical protein VJM12_19800 [Pyrinomonadaceae bacterium]|nr:hypothetical protein [Pyrinomonadaceae bacterium]
MNNLKSLVLDCQQRISQGASREDLILYLNQKGLTIVESMRILKETYQVSLGEAKKMVTAHPVWADTVRDGDILHEELEKAVIEEEADSSMN